MRRTNTQTLRTPWILWLHNCGFIYLRVYFTVNPTKFSSAVCGSMYLPILSDLPTPESAFSRLSGPNQWEQKTHIPGHCTAPGKQSSETRADFTVQTRELQQTGADRTEAPAEAQEPRKATIWGSSFMACMCWGTCWGALHVRCLIITESSQHSSHQKITHNCNESKSHFICNFQKCTEVT